MNLLIGLAISSIEELNINGDKTQALKRVRVILAGTRLPSDTTFGWLEKTIGFVPNVNIMKRFSDEKLTTKKVKKFLLMTMPKNKNDNLDLSLQMCVKLSSRDRKFDYFGFGEPKYKLYFYQNEEVGQEITELAIPAKTVASAREAFASFEQEKSEFVLKIKSIKTKSKEQYQKFLEKHQTINESQVEAQKMVTESDNKSLVERMATMEETLKSLVDLLHDRKPKGENQSSRV